MDNNESKSERFVRLAEPRVQGNQHDRPSGGKLV